MSPTDAKNTTLREYLMWIKSTDKPAISVEYGASKAEILEHFALMEL